MACSCLPASRTISRARHGQVIILFARSCARLPDAWLRGFSAIRCAVLARSVHGIARRVRDCRSRRADAGRYLEAGRVGAPGRTDDVHDGPVFRLSQGSSGARAFARRAATMRAIRSSRSSAVSDAHHRRPSARIWSARCCAVIRRARACPPRRPSSAAARDIFFVSSTAASVALRALCRKGVRKPVLAVGRTARKFFFGFFCCAY